MDLRWWAVALGGLGCLALCLILAMALPMTPEHRRLRPLAHVDRLTRLPEFAGIRRRETAAAVATVGLLVGLLGIAVLVTARPSGSGRDLDALHPEDVMLCVGAPVTDATTGQFLTYFARQVSGYDAQRIGLTSPTVRVLPLTRDYQYAAQRLGDYGQLAVRPGDPAPPGAQQSVLRSRAEGFARVVPYTDYAPNLRDTLALCLAGFPAADAHGTHRHSLIYLGPSTFGAAEQRSLFTDQQVAELADKAGVQVNAITPVGVTDDARRGAAALASLAERTGGRFFRDRGPQPGGTDSALTAHLDAIRANPAPVVLPNGARIAGRLPDDPNPLLLAALGGCVLLCVALAVRRR